MGSQHKIWCDFCGSEDFPIHSCSLNKCTMDNNVMFSMLSAVVNIDLCTTCLNGLEKSLNERKVGINNEK